MNAFFEIFRSKAGKVVFIGQLDTFLTCAIPLALPAADTGIEVLHDFSDGGISGSFVRDVNAVGGTNLGARTGGTNIIEGLIEVSLGFFLAGSIAMVFAAFPLAIVGAMMFLVGIELVKFSRDLRLDRELLPVAATVLGSLVSNMAIGFTIGMAVHYLAIHKRRDSSDAR